jgi:hypothetical protein
MSANTHPKGTSMIVSPTFSFSKITRFAGRFITPLALVAFALHAQDQKAPAIVRASGVIAQKTQCPPIASAYQNGNTVLVAGVQLAQANGSARCSEIMRRFLIYSCQQAHQLCSGLPASDATQCHLQAEASFACTKLRECGGPAPIID